MFEEARILIVDDDAEDLASLKRALESLGATIHTVRDPHEVLAATRRENPGVVILDALLPGLSGFDLCKQIKTDSALKGTQVVVVTGVYLRKQYRQEALQQFKADAFLTKPFRPPELQRLVSQLLAKWTKKPQKNFLRRTGRPGASSEAEKRGFWSRLFGRTEAEEAPTRIAPVRPARRAAKTVSAPRPGPKPSRVAAVKTPVVTKLAEPESKPDAVVESAATIAVSPDPSTKKPEEHAIATEPPSSSAGSEPIATGDEASTSHASEEPSGETASSTTAEDVSSASEEPPDAADASAPAAEPVTEIEETASVDDESSAEPEPPVPAVPAVPDVPDDASARDAPPVPEAAEEDRSAAKDEKAVQPPRADDAAPAESSAAEEASARDAPPVPEAAEEDRSAAKDEKAVQPPRADDAAPAESSAAEEASARDAPPVPEAAEEDQSAAKDEKAVQPPRADDATPAESSATEDAPAAATETRAVAPPAEEEKEVQLSDPPASVATIETQAVTTEEPASELPPLRRPSFSVGDVPIYGEQDFHTELKRELSKCRRVDRPLTLILVQVDDLTQIVELFGKEIREAVLRHVAELATWCLREIDLVGMITSKDLVALIAFASDQYGGSRVVNRMRKTVQKNPFRVGEELPPIMPALRFGMSSYPDDGDDVVGLIAEAYEDIE